MREASFFIEFPGLISIATKVTKTQKRISNPFVPFVLFVANKKIHVSSHSVPRQSHRLVGIRSLGESVVEGAVVN